MCIVGFTVFDLNVPRSGGYEINNYSTIENLLEVFIRRPGETGPDLRKGGITHEPLV
jgi:hypothetical protein